MLPPDAPATVEDVRATRRWTWVAVAWAVAASIIAVLALIQAHNNSNDNQPTSEQAAAAQQLKSQVDSFTQQANDRLDQFAKRLDETASSSDVEKLDKRLTKVEDDLGKLKTAGSDQADAVKKLQTDLDALSKRVDQLEQQQSQGGGGGGTQQTP